MVRLTHGELLINVVMHNKPKVPTGLHQKVRGKDRRLPIPLTQTTPATGEEAEPNPSWYSRGTWKSSNLPNRESHSQEEPTGLLVQDDGKSEGHAVIAWIEGETSPRAKASRRPSGLSARELLKKTIKGGKADDGSNPHN